MTQERDVRVGPPRRLTAVPTLLSSPRGAAQRNVVLQGEAAHDWFTESGFAVESGQFHLVTDVLCAPDARVGRIWHTAGRMTATRTRTRPIVLVQLEGTSEATIAGKRHSVSPGAIVFVPPTASLTLESDAAVARMEVETAGVALAPSTADLLERKHVLDGGSRGSVSVLIACINTALNSPLEPHDAGFPSFRLAIAHLVAGALTDAAGRHDGGPTTRRQDMYESALEIIAREASDPSFSVTRLAQTLNVSQQYVRLIFSAQRTTARAQIRSQRAELARAYLRTNADRATFTAAEAAHLAGFRDVETMRAALRATEDAARS